MSVDQSTLFNIRIAGAARSSALYTTLKARASFHSLCYSVAGSQPEAKPLVCARTAHISSRRGCTGLAQRSKKHPERRLGTCGSVNSNVSDSAVADWCIYLTIMF